MKLGGVTICFSATLRQLLLILDIVTRLCLLEESREIIAVGKMRIR